MKFDLTVNNALASLRSNNIFLDNAPIYQTINGLIITDEETFLKCNSQNVFLITPKLARGKFLISDPHNQLYRYYLKKCQSNVGFKLVTPKQFLNNLIVEKFLSDFIQEEKIEKKLLELNMPNEIIKIGLIEVDDNYIIIYKNTNNFNYLKLLANYFNKDILLGDFQGEENHYLFDIFPFHRGVVNDLNIKKILEECQDPRMEAIIESSSLTSYQKKAITYNGYQIYSPNQVIKQNKNYEMISVDGEAKMMKLDYNHANKYPIAVEEVYYHEFNDLISQVPEFKDNNRLELARISNYLGLFLVYKSNNQVLSGGVIEIVGFKSCFFSYAFTLPKYRNKGYFKNIMMMVNNYASLMKLDVYLSVENPQARKIYLEYGFKDYAQMQIK